MFRKDRSQGHIFYSCGRHRPCLSRHAQKMFEFFSECLRHAFVQVLCFSEENSSFTGNFLLFPVSGLCPYYLAVFQSFRRRSVAVAGAVPLIFSIKIEKSAKKIWWIGREVIPLRSQPGGIPRLGWQEVHWGNGESRPARAGFCPPCVPAATTSFRDKQNSSIMDSYDEEFDPGSG